MLKLNPMDYINADSGPGKFESEPPQTRYYYDVWLFGDGESYYPADHEDSPLYTLFSVDGEESETFDLACGSVVVLWEDSQGFVMTQTFEDHEVAIQFCDKHAGTMSEEPGV